MPDQNELLRRLSMQTGDPQAAEKLRTILSSPEGRQAARIISAQCADDLERAAQAAQRGDMAEAARLAQKLMRSNEGATLASRLRGLFGK